MVFSSVIFIFVYLPVFLALYYLCPQRYRSYFIFVGSYVFYAWWRIDFALLMLATTAFNYYVAMMIHRTLDQKWCKPILIGAIIGNLALLLEPDRKRVE